MLPEQPYDFIAEHFSDGEFASLCEQLGTRPSRLPGATVPAKARELQAYATRNRRLGDLLYYIGAFKDFFDPAPYVYLLIFEHVDADTVAQLCQDVGKLDCKGLGLTASDLRPYGPNRLFRREKALLLHTEAEKAGRLPHLLQAMKRRLPDLNLQAYDELIEKVPPDDQNDNDEENGEKAQVAIPEYEDFDLRVGWKRADGRYPVEVTRSPSGEMERPVWKEFPLEDYDFEDLVSYLQNLRARSADAVELGGIMRDLLFPVEVWTLFNNSHTSAKGQKKGVRLRLRIDPPELSRLPWEYCRDDRFGFFALQREIPVVRYVARPFAAGDVSAPDPMKVLVVIAAPEDQDALNVREEERRIRNTLAWMGDRVELTVLPHAVPEQLQAALAAKPHVFHFIGHGTVENGVGKLLFEDGARKSRALDAEQLKVLLRGTEVKVVVLNACKSAAHDARNAMLGVAPALVQAEIPAVIAMQFNVPDRTALNFTRDLYGFLAAGYPLDAAVTQMRIGAYIGAGDKYFWGIPVLFMRAPDGVIWQPDAEAIAQFMKARETMPLPIKEDLQKLLQELKDEVEKLRDEFKTGDVEDIVDDLEDAENLMDKSEPNLRRIERRLDSVIDILEDSSVDTAVDDLVPKAEAAKDLAGKLFA